MSCTECKTSRYRTDKFMDLSLVIRPFGSSELNDSVEGALDYFVRPEIMSDGNQVRDAVLYAYFWRCISYTVLMLLCACVFVDTPVILCFAFVHLC